MCIYKLKDGDVMKKILAIAVPIITLLLAGLCVMIFLDTDDDVAEKVTPVGVILNGNRNDMSWCTSHCEALEISAEKLNLSLTYRESVTVDTIGDTIRELVECGCEIVIANSFEFGEYLKQASEMYPEVYFFHCSGVDEGKNFTSYFGRMYQMRYLTGIAAGLQTETNEIGYVAAFPISEVNRGINAFVLGVRSVNPEAKVYVRWINSWVSDEDARNAAEKLMDEHNIDIITMHTDSVEPILVAEERGVMSIGYHRANPDICPETYLTAAVWDWEKFYTTHIQHCIQGKFAGDNYWDGIDTGIVAVAELSDKAVAGAAEQINAEYERLVNGTHDVFYGPVYDNEGVLRIAEEESMTDNAMLNEFDCYVEGVVIDED